MKILFCGLGGIGQRHLRNLSSLIGDDIEVHAYRVRKQNFKLLNDMTIEKNSNLENDYRITTHDSLEAALSTKPDLVMVCNPSSLHIPIAIQASQAGAHVFLEKPVSNNLDGITELQKVLNEKKLICYVGYNLRFHPAIKKMKSLVEDGFFGNILGCAVEVGEYLPGWHKYEDYRQMYASKSDLGGGVILSQIHEMDLIYWFFGLPKSILTVGGKYSNLEIDVEDTAHSLMQIDSKFGKFPVTLLQDFIQRPPTRTFKIVGDKGIVKVDLILNIFQKFNEEGVCIEHLHFDGFQRNDMFIEQTKHLINCIRGIEKPLVNLEEGVESLKLALAAKLSMIKNDQVAPSEIKEFS